MFDCNRLCLAILITGICTRGGTCDVEVHFDEGDWNTAVGTSVTTITFTGYPSPTLLFEQYLHLGVTFTTMDEEVFGPAWYAFADDGWGIYSGLDDLIEIEFDEPMYWVAVDHPATIAFDLYRGEEYVGYMCSLGTIEGPAFGGVVSTVPFDRVEITDCSSMFPHVDNLHFGPQVSWHGDVNRDGAIDLADIYEVLNRWGACPVEDDCIGDETGDGVVDVEDLIEVILSWS